MRSRTPHRVLSVLSCLLGCVLYCTAGDTADPTWPIYNSDTMATALFLSSDNKCVAVAIVLSLSVCCCRYHAAVVLLHPCALLSVLVVGVSLCLVTMACEQHA
jgi:hypothetical protein